MSDSDNVNKDPSFLVDMKRIDDMFDIVYGENTDWSEESQQSLKTELPDVSALLLSDSLSTEEEDCNCSYCLSESILEEAPAVEAPAVEAPAVEAPAVEAPAVEAPAVEAPADQNCHSMKKALIKVIHKLLKIIDKIN